MGRALYAAGMRDGDVVTHVDGLAATNETLEELNSKANEPPASPVRRQRVAFVNLGRLSDRPGESRRLWALTDGNRVSGLGCVSGSCGGVEGV